MDKSDIFRSILVICILAYFGNIVIDQNVPSEKTVLHVDLHEIQDPLFFDENDDVYIIVGYADNTTNVECNWTHYRHYQYQLPPDAIKLLFSVDGLDIDWSRWHHIITDEKNNLFIDGVNMSTQYIGNLSNCWVRFNEYEYKEICY